MGSVRRRGVDGLMARSCPRCQHDAAETDAVCAACGLLLTVTPATEASVTMQLSMTDLLAEHSGVTLLVRGDAADDGTHEFGTDDVRPSASAIRLTTADVASVSAARIERPSTAAIRLTTADVASLHERQLSRDDATDANAASVAKLVHAQGATPAGPAVTEASAPRPRRRSSTLPPAIPARAASDVSASRRASSASVARGTSEAERARPSSDAGRFRGEGLRPSSPLRIGAAHEPMPQQIAMQPAPPPHEDDAATLAISQHCALPVASPRWLPSARYVMRLARSLRDMSQARRRMQAADLDDAAKLEQVYLELGRRARKLMLPRIFAKALAQIDDAEAAAKQSEAAARHAATVAADAHVSHRETARRLEGAVAQRQAEEEVARLRRTEREAALRAVAARRAELEAERQDIVRSATSADRQARKDTGLARRSPLWERAATMTSPIAHASEAETAARAALAAAHRDMEKARASRLAAEHELALAQQQLLQVADEHEAKQQKGADAQRRAHTALRHRLIELGHGVAQQRPQITELISWYSAVDTLRDHFATRSREEARLDSERAKWSAGAIVRGTLVWVTAFAAIAAIVTAWIG